LQAKQAPLRLALLRHGRTAWNAERRIQGRRDEPLSETGRAALAGRRLPPEFAGWRAVTSPLRRARETAALLGLADATPEPRLVEMDWGRWEGRTLAELRALPDMAAREAAGLDFRPDGGESPREVQARALAFLRDCAAAGAPTIGITHKGVIRAVLALATGWTMEGEAPVRLRWDRLHLFALASDGTPRVERLNIELAGP
jgi:probable phosphoglycerate mutase